MHELKKLRPEAVPAALERARRYRFLNEPVEAESICLDILAIDPDHHDALVTLLLALTEQFDQRLAASLREAKQVVERLPEGYEREYYAGLILERRAKAIMARGGPGSVYVAYSGLLQAMDYYERAMPLRPAGTDDAILRWNTCARILDRHPELQPAPAETTVELLE